MREYIKRWFGMTSPAGDLEQPGQPAPSVTAAQRLKRLRTSADRASLWTEEPETCEVCGRRLLTGELPALFQTNDELVLACPVCAMDLAAAGYRSPQPPASVAA